MPIGFALLLTSVQLVVQAMLGQVYPEWTLTNTEHRITQTLDEECSSYQLGPITVDVPKTWVKTEIGGYGDWIGTTFINPKHPLEREIIVESDCVGCITHMQQHPEWLINLLPSQNVTHIHRLRDKHAVTFALVASNIDPYTGAGILALTTNNTGYGYVEIFLPAKDHKTMSQVITSFHISSSRFV